MDQATFTLTPTVSVAVSGILTIPLKLKRETTAAPGVRLWSRGKPEVDDQRSREKLH